jgi:phospholipid/cholesterol/gamma-HCH transport system substrate-binding protein
METHVNYIRVGAFVIGGFLAMILFILWLNKVGFGPSAQPYNIFFNGSIAGLKVGATVQYRGVPIGKVSTIAIDPKNVEQILVQVKINKETLIKENMVAALETYGLTGVSYVQIRGGTADAKNLIDVSDQAIPVIKSQSSLIEEVSETVPDMLKQMGGLIAELRDVFSDENRISFTKTLKNIEEMTSYFKPGNGKEKDTFLLELTKVISDLDATLIEVKSMSSEFALILKDNRGGLKEFTTTGLNAFTRFMTEGRESLAAIRRLSESLERSPSRFFYNDPKQGVPVR